MGVFRSEEMCLCQVFLPVETVYSIMAVLGEQKCVEFRDLNTDNLKGRRFSNEVQMCGDLEGKLHYLRLQTKDYNIKLNRYIGDPVAPNPRQMIDLMTPGTADFDLLRKLYNEVKQISYNLSPLERTVQLHLEYQAILKTACQLLFQKVTSLSDPELGHDFNVHVIGGVLPKIKWNGFERTLWRLCHGNYVLQVSDIPSKDPNNIRRLFVILAHGTFIKDKITKLCLSYSADMYDIPESRSRCNELSKRNKSIIADLKKTVATSQEHYTKLLATAANNLSRWLVEIKKMKSIYHNMNKFKLDDTETFLIAECWVPKGHLEHFKEILIAQSKKVGTDLHPMIFHLDYKNEQPPTHFELNSFTKSFQKIINAYGIANYKELNPMPYTVITFPFLFAVMFGDVGHAIILIIIGLTLIYKKKTLKNIKSAVFQMIFQGRFIILLMGLFSLYTGFIYNDIFSYFTNFGAKWKLSKMDSIKDAPVVVLDPKYDFFGDPYPFGIDPVWRVAENEISIMNSLKMKLSIVFGVVHMMFGTWLSLFNMMYFKDNISIFFEFIPQLIFFGALFGYFVFLIFIKWLTYGPTFPSGRSSFCAPSIIITFVNMVLSSERKYLPGCDEYIYKNQKIVERCLFLTALACVPVILLVKPLIAIITKTHPPERNTHKHRATRDFNVDKEDLFDDLTQELSVLNKTNEYKKNHMTGTGDLIIHQIIHTIEFVLGTVSYTASYLRLWALSLAHSHLSNVLMEMVLLNVLSASANLPFYIGGFLVAFGFIAWASLTIGVLIIMEGLSAFLHALRLHWMEFQNKFYVGQGYPFTPFSFKLAIIEAASELE